MQVDAELPHQNRISTTNRKEIRKKIPMAAAQTVVGAAQGAAVVAEERAAAAAPLQRASDTDDAHAQEDAGPLHAPGALDDDGHAAQALGSCWAHLQGGAGAAASSRSPKKQRFVWTKDMHERFENAVKQLGTQHAKPQAIRQAMAAHISDPLPTRQNIKSHLQKYRLLLSKRAGRVGQGGPSHLFDGELDASASSYGAPRPRSPLPDSKAFAAVAALPADAVPGVFAPPSLSRLPSDEGPQMLDKTQQLEPPMDVAETLKSYIISLSIQLDLQKDYQQRLRAQKDLQLSLSRAINASTSCLTTPTQLTQLAQHVLSQRQMLQHLHSLSCAHTIEAARLSTLLYSSGIGQEAGVAYVSDQGSTVVPGFAEETSCADFDGFFDPAGLVEVPPVGTQAEVLEQFAASA